MDKRILSIFCAALLQALSGLPLRAQSVFAGRSSLSVQAGPSWYTGRFLGLTHAGADYRDDLRRGVAWSVDYWWRGARGDGEGEFLVEKWDEVAETHAYLLFERADGLAWSPSRHVALEL